MPKWLDWLRGNSKGAAGVAAETSLPDIRKGTDLFELLTGGMSASGIAVTEQSAMRVSSVYGSVNLIAGAIASLPLPVYERNTEGRARVAHPYWWILNESPNASMSAAVFWEYMVASLLLHGDAFAVIGRGPQRNDSRMASLTPVHKSRVEVFKDHDDSLSYRVQKDDDTWEVVLGADMIHIPGPGFNGLNGLSQLRYALRTTVGTAIAADQYSGKFFENSSRPDFAIEVPGNLTVDQQEMLRRTWAERHAGIAQSHLPALLTGGIKVHQLTMSAEDAQLIDTRRFQVEDIARVFGVPPHMIGHTTNTTSWGSGVEQMGIGFVKYTLQRHLVKIEQELNRKLWPLRERYFVEFNTSGLERGDYKTRNEGYRIALGRAGEPAWMSVNEVRKLENLPPVAGGNEMFTGGSQNEATA